MLRFAIAHCISSALASSGVSQGAERKSVFSLGISKHAHWPLGIAKRTGKRFLVAKLVWSRTSTSKRHTWSVVWSPSIVILAHKKVDIDGGELGQRSEVHRSLGEKYCCIRRKDESAILSIISFYLTFFHTLPQPGAFASCLILFTFNT